MVALAWGILICMYLWPPIALVAPWHKLGAGAGKVEWDETPAELADAFQRESAGPAAEVEARIQQEIQEQRLQVNWWKRIKRTLRYRWRRRLGYVGEKLPTAWS